MTRPSNWPKGWRLITDRPGIYYRVPARVRHLWDNKSTFKLGLSEAEAFRTWFARTGGADDLDQITVEYMLDVFMSDYVALHLADETYHTYKYHVQPLKRVFGHQHPNEIEPVHVYRYLDNRPRVAGNREASVLSSALTFAVEKRRRVRGVYHGQLHQLSQTRCEESQSGGAPYLPALVKGLRGA